MVVRAFVFEIRGGAQLAEFEPADLSWSMNGNEPESVDVTIDLSSPVEATRDWPNLGSAWNHGIALDVGGRVIGGPILPHTLDDDQSTLQIVAKGLRSATALRSVLPAAALTQPLVDPLTGLPDPTLDSSWAGFDYGTIGKKILQQMQGWPSWGDVPIEYHADRAGTRFSSYAAVDRKKVDAALTDLSALEDGPDIRLDLRWVSEDEFGWLYRSGSEAQPRLQSESVFAWEIGKASGLTVQTNPTRMGSVAWSTGGRSSDRTLIEMTYDPHLVDNGGLLLEIETAADSSVELPETLRQWNAEALRTARRPWSFWSFKVPAEGEPKPFEYGPGDLVDVIVVKDQPVAGGYIKKGTYRRRIAGLSGGLDDFVTITCGEDYDNG
jgi:hypothetical protein